MRALRIVMVMLLLGMTAVAGAAQTRTAGQINSQNVRLVLRRIQDRIDLLQNSLNAAGNRNQVYNNRDENVNIVLSSFADAVRQMQQQLNRRASTTSDAQLVLDRGRRS